MNISINLPPVVSVVMPVYNSANFLVDAIESIINQTFENLEFIIVDDCSTDNSLEIINSFTDNRIKVIELNNNSGNYFARNIGIQKAQGKYIAVMDADDISLPERIEKQVVFFENNPSCFVVGSWAYVIDENNKILNTIMNETNSEMIKVKSLLQMEFFHPTVMFRKEVFEELGFKYNSNKKYAQDYALISKIALKFKVANIPEYLLKYRRSENQISQKNLIKQTEYFIDAIKSNLESFGINVSDERGRVINLITRNHKKLPVLENDLVLIQSLIHDIYSCQNKIISFNTPKLRSFLQQKYLDCFHNYEGKLIDYINIYFKLEVVTFKSFNLIGFLKLLKRFTSFIK